MSNNPKRDLQVQRVIVIEGLANATVLVAKLVVGITTGSLAVLGDAIHSFTDVANNIVAWFVIRLSSEPADREHPYGHRKFETLAVFGLATLLTVLAVELALHAINRDQVEVGEDSWALGVMLVVLAINIVVATWQRHWAKKLGSDILLADADHTFADVLTTIVVIGGWQLSARGYPWIDTACALGVAGLIMYLAWGLFKRVLPILIDEYAIDPEALRHSTESVPGVIDVRRIRSRWVGADPVVDMVITVDPDISAADAHVIADAIEDQLEETFKVHDISIHVEPHH